MCLASWRSGWTIQGDLAVSSPASFCLSAPPLFSCLLSALLCSAPLLSFPSPPLLGVCTSGFYQGCCCSCFPIDLSHRSPASSLFSFFCLNSPTLVCLVLSGFFCFSLVLSSLAPHWRARRPPPSPSFFPLYGEKCLFERQEVDTARRTRNQRRSSSVFGIQEAKTGPWKPTQSSTGQAVPSQTRTSSRAPGTGFSLSGEPSGAIHPLTPG